MNYRTLGRTNLRVSEISMGLEHLLSKDQDTVTNTIKAAIDAGVNYFDCLSTAEYAENTKTNEGYERLAIAIDGQREKLTLTFLAFVNRPLAYTQGDFECFLKTLNTGCADIFIVACCDKQVELDAVAAPGGLLEYAKALRAEGKIKHIGFSTHNSEIAHKVIESGEYDVLMYPINPAFDVVANEEVFNSDILGNIWDAAYNYAVAPENTPQPRKDVYAACEQHNIGLVAMKPFAGGFIFEVEKDAGFTALNLVSYALEQVGVSAVIPGCTSPEEIGEILSYYTAPAAARDYSEAVAKSRWSAKGHCLYCNHCLPCPANIDIARVNKLLNSADADAAQKYAALNVKASACLKCGICESRCPFEVKVIDRMASAAEVFEG